MEYILRIYILCITTTFSSALIISQCVGSQIEIQPVEFTNGQEFYQMELSFEKFIAAWFKGKMIYTDSERVKFVNIAQFNTLTLLIEDLQQSDAGEYKLRMVLEGSKILQTHYFTVAIDQGCTTQKTETTTQQTETTTQQINTTTYLVPMPPTTTFSSALIISQCVSSDLILRPAEYADDQEFVVFDIRKVSEPKRSIATWPGGSVGERVKVIDEGYQNATVIIHHLQPSDAGLYEIGVVLTSSKWLTQQFTVQINALAQNCTNNLIREEGGNISLTSVISETSPSFLITFQMNVKLYIVGTNQTVLSNDPNNRTQLVFRDKEVTLTVTDLSMDDEGVYRFFDTDCYSLTISRGISKLPMIHNTTESIDNLDQKSKTLTISIAVVFLVISVILCIILITRVKTKSSQPNPDAERLQNEAMLPLNEMGHTSA